VDLQWGRVDCIHLAEDRVKWSAVVKMVMNFAVQNMCGHPGLAQELLASQYDFCTMYLFIYLFISLLVVYVVGCLFI